MGEVQDESPVLAFEKDPLELTVEDVYDISFVIGKDLLKISRSGQEVSDLQFRIVRVLEMLESSVSRYSLSMEELRLERDSLRGELDRVVAEGSSGNGNSIIGPDKLLIDLKDPNRPRFTMQELKEVLQERNQLKTQLLLAQEELQLYKSGVLPQPILENPPSDPPHSVTSEESIEHKEEKSAIQKLFSFTRK